MDLQKMRLRHSELLKQMEKLLDNAAEGVLSEDDQTAFNDLRSEADKLATSIKARERLEEELRSLDNPVVEPTRPDPQPDPASGRITDVHDNRADAPFRTFGEQLKAVYRAAATQGQDVDERLLALNERAAGANEAVPAEGGFLVQTDFSTALLDRVNKTGVLMNRCFQIPISSPSNAVTLPIVDETSRANGSRWGGVKVYWESEGTTPTAKKPKFAQLGFKLGKLFGLGYSTDELLVDASAMTAIYERAFSEEILYKIDDGIINGDGSAGQMMGILNAAATVSVAKESGQSASTVVVQNILKMYSRLYGRSRQRAAWFINQDVEPQLWGLTMPSGTTPIYMPAGGVADEPYARLLGRPVIPIEQAATLGTVGDIILADLGEYGLATKGGMETAWSMHVRFIYDEGTFRITYRVTGQPLWKSALTPAKGSNTQSPFITLATRA